MIAIVRQRDLKRKGMSAVEGFNLRDAKELAKLWSMTENQPFVVVDMIGKAEEGTWSVPKGGI